MEYAALTFWMFVIVFTALAVHRLLSSLVQPRIVNFVLLPGTLVAQLGHILGLLVTGGTVNNTSLVKDDESGEPQTGSDPKTRVPLIGTIVIALLPMIGCAVAIYWVAHYFGAEILRAMEGGPFDPFVLPTSVASFFAAVRGVLGLVERFVNVVRASDLSHWQTLLFLYLVVCLTVRMAPLTGNLRGSLGAILLFGILAFLLGQFTKTDSGTLQTAWPLIVFSIAVLGFLLIASLLLAGAVGLVRTVLGQDASRPASRK